MLCTFADGTGPTRPSLRMTVLGTRSRIGTRAMPRRAMQDMLFTPDWLRDQDRAALAEQLNALFGRDLGVSAPIVDELAEGDGPLRRDTVQCEARVNALLREQLDAVR